MILSLAFASAVVIRSLAEIASLSDADIRRNPSFELTGAVTGIDSHSDFSLSDGNEDAFIYHGTAVPPEPGDHITVRGRVYVNDQRYNMLQADSIAVLSPGQPPAPVEATLADIARGDIDYRVARLRGRVTDIHKDELSTNCWMLTLSDGYEMAIVPFDSRDEAADYLNSEISITGIIRPIYKGRRIFSTYLISPLASSPVEVLSRPPADRFLAPPLDPIHHITPQRLSKLGYRRVSGTVLVTWNARHILVDCGDAMATPVHIVLRDEQASLPARGDGIEAVGFVETDLFSILLTDASWRPDSRPDSTAVPTRSGPKAFSIRDIVRSSGQGESLFQYLPIGRTIALTGTIRHLSAADDVKPSITIEEDGDLIDVNACNVPAVLDSLRLGCRIRVTGVFILDADRWRPSSRYPSVQGAQLVLRAEDDIEILEAPPWWTPGRFILVLSVLLLALCAILIWNRTLNRLVENRSRALIKERLGHDAAELKKEERTRLAVELHDTLSQNLTGIAFQLDAAELVAEQDPSHVLPYLRRIRLKMQSCRDNLRNCLWDLRNLAIDESSLDQSIRKTLSPVIDKAEVSIDFPVRNNTLGDSIVHAILCIVRELTANAIRHGKATHVVIRGEHDGNGINLTVRDDGSGFDPSRHPGVDEGHFGLQGVAERVSRFNGRLVIDSDPTHGTTISIRGLHEEV